MNFNDIPDEILIMIVKKLDQKSVINFYETSSKLRDLICCYGLIKKLKLSLNTFASVTFLKTPFFKDVAQHLQELNLCGAPDVTKASLLTPMKKLKCLKTLNISYTQVTLLDLIDLCPMCPTIKNIAIDFKLSNVIQKVTKQLQDIFENFESVHFVGSLNNLVHSNLPMLILRKSALEYLKYTISWSENSFYHFPGEDDVKMVNFKRFEIFILNWTDKNNFTSYLHEFPVFTQLDNKKHEFIIINQIHFDTNTVYMSKGFESKFSFPELNMQDVFVQPDFDFNSIFGNIAILLFNREQIDFNDNFHSDLQNEVSRYFPRNVAHKTLGPSSKAGWFYCNSFDDWERKDLQPVVKRKRLANAGISLNFDFVCENRQTLDLSILFDKYCSVTLSPQCEYLKKLTYLSFHGPVRYNVDFFSILFRSCNQLETLSIDGNNRCAFAVSRAIPLSSSLKNIRLVDMGIDFRTMFSSFSQCSTLENIYLADQSSELNELGDPNVLFEKCVNLYSFCIYASMTDSNRTKKWQLFNKAKNRCKKPHLHMELHALNKIREEYNNKEIKMLYDPFVKVFKVYSILD